MVAESLAAISSTISIIQSIKDALGAAIEARDAAVFREKAVELNAQILAAQALALSAQAAQAALVKRESDLEAEIVRLKDWQTEKARYELGEVAPGCFARVIKEGMENGEPSHKICEQCYQDGRKSVLQTVYLQPSRSEALDCHHCGARVYVSGMPHKDHPLPPRQASRR